MLQEWYSICKMCFSVGLWIKCPEDLLSKWEYVGITVSYIRVFKDTLTGGVCVWEAGNSGKEWKLTSLALKWNIGIHAVTHHCILKRLNVAQNPHNILEMYKNADRLDLRLSWWFWGFALCILISFVMHICFNPINPSVGIHEWTFICCVIHGRY